MRPEISAKMKVAVIDMGTNTFHLLIVDVSAAEWKMVYREKAAVKIGEKGINEGRITPEAEERAIATLAQFKRIIDEHQVSETFATATSAIRNAKNGLDVVARIEREVQIPVRIISGLQEAEYIYFGVKKALKIGSDPALIMDIGGGSIEFIIGTDEAIYWKQSFEIGGQRMVEKFQKHDPIPTDEEDLLKIYLDAHLLELYEAVAKYQPRTLIGSSGTFDTLSDIYCLKETIDRSPDDTEYPLTIPAFYDILATLKTKSREERLRIPGMIPLRVDMIVVASILIAFVLERLDMRKIRVSAYALKEGVLLKTLEELRNGKLV